MTRLATIHIENQYLHFSAAHFTIFSATERERLHGHNFHVSADIVAAVGENGMCFDYNVAKGRLKALCSGLDEYTLLPANSPFLEIEEQDHFYRTLFNHQEMYFLKADTLILPVANITLEELSDYLVDQLTAGDVLQNSGLVSVSVAVASGPGQKISSQRQF